MEVRLSQHISHSWGQREELTKSWMKSDDFSPSAFRNVLDAFSFAGFLQSKPRLSSTSQILQIPVWDLKRPKNNVLKINPWPKIKIHVKTCSEAYRIKTELESYTHCCINSSKPRLVGKEKIISFYSVYWLYRLYRASSNSVAAPEATPQSCFLRSLPGYGIWCLPEKHN